MDLVALNHATALRKIYPRDLVPSRRSVTEEVIRRNLPPAMYTVYYDEGRCERNRLPSPSRSARCGRCGHRQAADDNLTAYLAWYTTHVSVAVTRAARCTPEATRKCKLDEKPWRTRRITRCGATECAIARASLNPILEPLSQLEEPRPLYPSFPARPSPEPPPKPA